MQPSAQALARAGHYVVADGDHSDGLDAGSHFGDVVLWDVITARSTIASCLHWSNL